MSTNLKEFLSRQLKTRSKIYRYVIYLNSIAGIAVILGLIFNPNVRSNLVELFLAVDRIGEVLYLGIGFYFLVYMPIRVLNAAYLARGINENFHNRMATSSKAEG